jgi:purine-binding chemotaxis protein CheW
MSDPVTQTANAARRELISFRIGDQEFCVDIMQVREIRGWTPATPLPRTPSFIKGVINLRGAVLPIVDLGARLGLETSEPSARHVIMVVNVGGRTVGLLVEAVSDIINLSDDMVQPTPDIACDQVKTFVKGLFAVDGRMISLISLDRVLPDMEAEAA